jgi:hypothetical protein
MYINKETLKYPLEIGDIQLEYPNFKNGDTVPEKYAEVLSDPPPVYDGILHSIYSTFPTVREDGTWRIDWEIRENPKIIRQNLLANMRRASVFTPGEIFPTPASGKIQTTTL